MDSTVSGIVLTVRNALNKDSCDDNNNLEDGREIPTSGFVDHTHLVASLPIMKHDAHTKDLLIEYILRNHSALLFLKYTSNFWPKSSNVILHCGVFIISRFYLTVMAIVMFTFVFINAIDHNDYRAASCVVDSTITVAIVSALYAQHLNQRRLNLPSREHDKVVIDESIRISQYFLWSCLFTVALSCLLLIISSITIHATYEVLLFNIYLTIGGIFMSQTLAFNMFFLIMDLKVSNLLLDQMFILADKHLLSFKLFNMVRNDIHRRVEESRWASDFIIIPCLASMLSIIILIFVATSMVWSFNAAWITGLLKELIFVTVAFWYVAKVNGKADELTQKLSKMSWLLVDSEMNTDCIISGSSGNSGVRSVNNSDIGMRTIKQPEEQQQQRLQQQYNAMVHDINRLSVHASSISEPISFTLVFKRVSWETLTVSAAGFVVSVLIGVIKSLLDAQEQ